MLTKARSNLLDLMELSALKVAVSGSEKLVAEATEVREPRRKGTSAVGSRSQATTTEDWEDFMCAVVTVVCGVCKSARLS
jgi:hypothetical protein